MSQKKRAILGVLSLFPMSCFLVMMVVIPRVIAMGDGDGPPALALMIVIPVFSAGPLLSLILMGYDVYYEWSHNSGPTAEKLVWTLYVLFWNWAAVPFYWYFRLRSEPGKDAGSELHSPVARVGVGLLSCGPALFLAVLLATFLDAPGGPPQGPSLLQSPLFAVGVPATILSAVGLVAYYLDLIWSHPEYDENQKTIWSFVGLVANLAALPVLWFVHFYWNQPEGERNSGS